jgi:DNA helicase-2/ATP-dependent DNA helicase PcrA
MREYARQHSISMWQALLTICNDNALPARALGALQSFVALIEKMAFDTLGLALAEQVDHVTANSGLIDHYHKEKGEKGQARIENLEELVNAAREFEYDAAAEENELDPLSTFLSHAALEAGDTQGDPWEDCVQLMTLHSAKGLEFPLVFICGVEEGLFPHQMSMDEPGRLEEERRLCYVGITRARQLLYLTHAEQRRLHGQEHHSLPSRFIREIPAKLLLDVRPKARITRPVRDWDDNDDELDAEGLHLGQRVLHAKFGEGVVLDCEGRGSNARVQVEFDSVGTKWLVAAYANLVAC